MKTGRHVTRDHSTDYRRAPAASRCGGSRAPLSIASEQMPVKSLQPSQSYRRRAAPQIALVGVLAISVVSGRAAAQDSVRAAAQDAPAPSSALPAPGTYQYALVPDSSESIPAAVNRTVQHMSFITRPIARGRLNKVNPLPQKVVVEVTKDTLAVAFDGGNPIATPLSGDSVQWINTLTQEKDEAHASVSGDTARQIITAHDGQRENAYVFPNNGASLQMLVTVTSHRLPQPLTYKLVFTRSDAQATSSTSDHH
jgi:hypothetical protein